LLVAPLSIVTMASLALMPAWIASPAAGVDARGLSEADRATRPLKMFGCVTPRSLVIKLFNIRVEVGVD
jgi:hypothetical protein